MSRKILIFAPHADDETLGCGGIIAKNTFLGNQVKVVVVTGAGGEKHKHFSNELFLTVQNEFKKAMAVLSVNDYEFLNFPSTMLDIVGRLELNIAIDKITRKFQPSDIYVPFAGDMHNDHRMVCEAVAVATRPYLNYVNMIENIYAYETLSETHLKYPSLGASFLPNVHENVSDFFKLKLKALSKYPSQLQSKNQPRTLDAIENLAKMRGNHIGVKYAEAFVLLGTYRRD